MPSRFEELDWCPTPLGELSLRRRTDPLLRTDVYEVKLGDEFLMSSAFTVAEEELARLGLGGARGSGPLAVVVGGLGLGYTARAALADPRVGGLLVVDALPEVIGWHERGLLPHARDLTGDRRTRLLPGDFFAMAAGEGFDPDEPGRRFDVILLDVDHSPAHVLHPRHAAFYTPEGLARLAAFLEPGGVFALWSNDPPEEGFTTTLRRVFPDSEAHVVTFDNPIQGGESANTVYVARAAS